MAAPNVGSWIRIGLWALPLYGLLILWTTFTHQPDLNTDFGAYARYVSTTNYLIDHLFGSILGVTLANLNQRPPPCKGETAGSNVVHEVADRSRR
jgi:hypothetical protein